MGKGALNLSAWTRRRLERLEKATKDDETVKLIPDLMPEGACETYTSPITPSSAFHIRNRLLSRMGTKVRGHSWLGVVWLTVPFSLSGSSRST